MSGFSRSLARMQQSSRPLHISADKEPTKVRQRHLVGSFDQRPTSNKEKPPHKKPDKPYRPGLPGERYRRTAKNRGGARKKRVHAFEFVLQQSSVDPESRHLGGDRKEADGKETLRSGVDTRLYEIMNIPKRTKSDGSKEKTSDATRTNKNEVCPAIKAKL